MAEATEVATTQEAQEEQPLQFCTFRLDRDFYGVEILHVQEIIRPLRIFPVPATPDFLLGVINLRGNILPVVDIKRILKGKPWQLSSEAQMLILQHEALRLGLTIDAISEIAHLPPSQLEPFVPSKDDRQGKYIKSFGRLPTGELLAVVDVHRLIPDLRIR